MERVKAVPYGKPSWWMVIRIATGEILVGPVRVGLARAYVAGYERAIQDELI